MQMNRILAVYPDLAEHGVLIDVLSGSCDEIICVCSVIEAVKVLMEQRFNLIFVDSKMLTGGNSDITTTLKTVSNAPVIVVDEVVYRKTVNEAETPAESRSPSSSHAEHHHSPADKDLHYHRVLTFDELIIDPNRREVVLNGVDLCFTKIEFDILYFLARHKGRVMSRDQIYANVWTHDTSFDVDELVKAHIKRMRKKFAHARHEYIQNIRGIGYKFSD